MFYNKVEIQIFVMFLATLWTISDISKQNHNNANQLQKIEQITVVDGDTIKGVINNQIIKIRLSNIDCFENKVNQRAYWQAEIYNKSLSEVLKTGNESKTILLNLLKNEKDNIYVTLKGLDKFKRTLGKIYIISDKKKLNVNQYMLEYGKCVPYKPKPQSWKLIK
ncbi:MAG: thermonuclease family protein [Acetobacter sp.]|nr:thermonuclease family protein [Acetobacter sp.]